MAIVGLTLFLTSAALWLLHLVLPGAPTWLETEVVGTPTAVATAAKFTVMKRLLFAPTETAAVLLTADADIAPVGSGHVG